MTYSQFDPAAQSRVPWNFGAKVGPKRPFSQKQIWAIRFYLDREQRIRDRALFDLAIDSKLRGCDLVQFKIGDLVSGPDVRKRATITQRKTGRPVQFEIASYAQASLFAWLERRGGSVGDYVFPSRVDHARHLSTRQYARPIASTHSSTSLPYWRIGIRALYPHRLSRQSGAFALTVPVPIMITSPGICLATSACFQMVRTAMRNRQSRHGHRHCSQSCRGRSRLLRPTRKCPSQPTDR